MCFGVWGKVLASPKSGMPLYGVKGIPRVALCLKKRIATLIFGVDLPWNDT